MHAGILAGKALSFVGPHSERLSLIDRFGSVVRPVLNFSAKHWQLKTMSRWHHPNQIREGFPAAPFVQQSSPTLPGAAQVFSASPKPYVQAFAESPSLNSTRFDSSWLLALRAGVLRRAVSSSGRRAGNTGAGARAERGARKANIIGKVAFHAQSRGSIRDNHVRPNPSLNRTLHSLSAFGLQKPSPNAANLFRAG